MKPERNPWFDNARWLAGSLVVVIHMNQGFQVGGRHGTLIDWWHQMAHPMRLPLFAILVGYFTHVTLKPRDYHNLIRSVIIPLTLVSSAWILMRWYYTGTLRWSPVQPQPTLWFLYGVIVWRAAAPYLWRVRYPLVLAVLASMFAPLHDDIGHFQVLQIVSMSPFVVIGMKLRHERNWLEKRTPTRTAVAIALVVTWIVVSGVAWWFHSRHLLPLNMATPYTALFTPLQAIVIRGVLIAVMASVALATLYLMPRRRVPIISYVGAGGFTIYLLHGFVIHLVNYNFPLWTDRSIPHQILGVVAAFALALVLGSKPVRVLVRPIVQPKVNWLFKDEAQVNADTTTKTTAPARQEPGVSAAQQEPHRRNRRGDARRR